MKGLIRRTFTYFNKTIMFIKLYKALVRPHLECCNIIGHPVYKKKRKSLLMAVWSKLREEQPDFWSSPLMPPIRSANQRFGVGLPPMEMDVWWSWSVFCIIFSRNKLNRMGETESSKHLLWTPNIVLKNTPSLLFMRIALLEFSCSAQMALSWTSPSAMLMLLRTWRRSVCQTLSNAFLKAIMLWNRLCWSCSSSFMMTWLLKVCSTVLQSCLKPASCDTYIYMNGTVVQWVLTCALKQMTLDAAATSFRRLFQSSTIV